MKWVDRLKEFSGSVLGILLWVIFGVGNLYWFWLSILFKKFWMFVALFFPLTAFVTAPIGAWALIFGTPDWLVDLTKDTDSPNGETITEKQLRSFANKFNETVPQRVTSYLTLMNLSIGPGPTMAFTYVWEDGPALEAYLENPEIENAAALRRVCSDPKGLRMFLDNDVRLKYTGYKSDGTHLYEVEYDVSDCAE